MRRETGNGGVGVTVAKLMTAPLDLSLWEDWRLLAEARDLRTCAAYDGHLPGVKCPDVLITTADGFETEHALRCGG